MAERTNKYALIIKVFLLILLISSCSRNVVYNEAQIMEDNTWNLMNTLTFDIPIEDTINSNNVFFSIRTGTAYQFRNIFLFVSTTSPEGKTISDTLEYYLADEAGKWYGKGFGDIKELLLPYKSNVYFPLKGTYRFTVGHGMRAEDLKGVYDFGMRVEKTNNR
ncbi:MAG TPA: gliding motility lipoprotein GldH [Bacteroidales bacterium]|nr:gliding motility lipoprotein GldH [Bacteroidales bacterium]